MKNTFKEYVLNGKNLNDKKPKFQKCKITTPE